jgi:hypothetical protein
MLKEEQLKQAAGSKAIPWFRLLVTVLCPRRSRFSPESVCVNFVVDKVALG